MISEDENIIVKRSNNVHMLGSGFNSHAEIKDEIKRCFDNHPGEYMYGTMDDLGSMRIEKKYPKKKSYTNLDEDKFKLIEKNAESSEVISDYYEHRVIREYPDRASIYRQNIRYSEGEVDFSFRIKNDLFDAVPVSTLDEDIENKIRDIFGDLVDGNAIYLGYKSTYAKRGHRDPFVKVYGRLKRDSEKDKEIRKLYDFDFITGIYWSTDNITPIPIYMQNDEKDVDVIAVTKYIDSNDSYEEISDDILDKVKDDISYLENNYNMKINQIGKVQYQKEFGTVYIGVKFEK